MPAPPEFSIPVGDLDASGKPFVFPIRAAWIRGALEDNEATARGPDGILDIRASKSGNDVVIHGTLRAELEAPCARCLEPVAIPIDHTVSVLMVPRSGLTQGSRNGDEHELTPEEADTLSYEGETVILDDLVREELILESPMIPLCSEACPGMRPPPGKRETDPVERAIDPRLMPLMRFQSKAKKE